MTILPPLLHSLFPSPLTGVWENFFGIKDARRWVLEHFGHKSQHLYEPGFLTVSCNFRISSKCACSIVNRWSAVLLKYAPFHWVIAAYQCYKLFDRGRLAVTLYRISGDFFCPPPWNFNDATCFIFPLDGRPCTIAHNYRIMICNYYSILYVLYNKEPFWYSYLSSCIQSSQLRCPLERSNNCLRCSFDIK